MKVSVNLSFNGIIHQLSASGFFFASSVLITNSVSLVVIGVLRFFYFFLS